MPTFCRTIPAPVVIALVGVQTLFHPNEERATSSVFGQLELLYVPSTATSIGFADLAAINVDSPQWYKLY